jgi:hypothetical protein
MRVGVAHHLGWAVAVTATADHEVVDRRRIELIEFGLPTAPIHHQSGVWEMHGSDEPPDDTVLAELVAEVRASALRASSVALGDLATDVSEPVVSLSVRSWPADFPTDIATLRQVPYESRADSIMYLQVLADVAHHLGWEVHHFDAKRVEADAAARLGDRADDVLVGPRVRLGSPWAKDHRVALAATVVAG